VKLIVAFSAHTGEVFQVIIHWVAVNVVRVKVFFCITKNTKRVLANGDIVCSHATGLSIWAFRLSNVFTFS